MKCEKSGNHTISYQSLLLTTTVLNDTALGEGLVTNIALGYLPLYSHLELYISYKLAAVL